MGIVVVNGTTYEVPDGSNISVVNNAVFIDGKPMSEKLSGIVEVKVTGDLNIVRCEYDLKVSGNTGSVNAGRDVKCGNVQGNVNAGRDVDAEKIEGSVAAGRDVSI